MSFPGNFQGSFVESRGELRVTSYELRVSEPLVTLCPCLELRFRLGVLGVRLAAITFPIDDWRVSIDRAFVALCLGGRGVFP